MKRWLLILLLLPISPSAEILDSIDDYAVEMRMALGFKTASTNNLDDTTAHTFIRESFNKMTSMLRPIKRVETFTTSYRQNTYSLPDSVIGVISVYWRRGDSIKSLQYLPIDDWSRTIQEGTTGKQKGKDSRPTYYDYIDDKIFVYPAPTNWGGLVDTFRIVTWGRQVSLDTAKDLSQMPVQYRGAVLDYATMKAAVRRQHPFTQLFISLYQETMQALNASLNSRKDSNVQIPPNN